MKSAYHSPIQKAVTARSERIVFEVKRMKKRLSVFCLTGWAAFSLQAAERPNIILIMADDVSWEAFGCYGSEEYETPHIDALASKGVRFKHCYSTPICTPSRVMIMTGQYNFRNYTHFGYLNPKDKTFGQLMQQAGYKTAVAGKWQLNGLYNSLPGHDDNTRPNQAGFDEYCLWQLTQGKGKGERFWSPLLEQNGRLISNEACRDKYGPDMFCDFICGFMERNQAGPFFVYYPMVLVHDPFVPTPDTIGGAPRTQAANKAPEAKDEKKANFQAMVNYMDKIVGRIVARTEELGLAENTLILFTADNGTNRGITSNWKGQSIQGGKGGMKDMGTHVPLVAYWKTRTPKGIVLDDLVDFTDFYPTLAEAAGISLGEGDPLDGRSFLAGRGTGCSAITSPIGTRRPGSLRGRRSISSTGTAAFTHRPAILKRRTTFQSSSMMNGASLRIACCRDCSTDARLRRRRKGTGIPSIVPCIRNGKNYERAASPLYQGGDDDAVRNHHRRTGARIRPAGIGCGVPRNCAHRESVEQV